MKTIKVMLVLSMLIFVGCEEPRVLFPLAIGNQWVLRDQVTGHLTKWTVKEQKDIGCYGTAFNVFISKEFPEDYWAPGAPYNLNLFMKYANTDGSLIAPAMFGTSFLGVDGDTANLHSSNNIDPIPYTVIPVGLRSGETFVTTMLIRNHAGVYTPCMSPGDSGVTLSAQDGIYRVARADKFVDTPKFKGKAQCYTYSEGYAQPLVWDVNNENNAEEWCYAPAIGLVQLTNLHYHYAGIDYEHECQFNNVTNPNQLAGADWAACTSPTLTSKHINQMVLKLTDYKLN